MATVEGEAPPQEESEEEDDDEDDEMPADFIRPASAAGGRGRTSVSAEAYGDWNKKVAFDPPVHPKTDDQKERLKGVLSKSFLFNTLNAADFEVILNAVEEIRAAPGENIITEGDAGNFCFVIEGGSADCKKTLDGEEVVVKTCGPGDVFGELALLYSIQRQATVEAKEACLLWRLDRGTFNHIVKDGAIRQREKHTTFLRSVSLLATLDDTKISQIADVLRPYTFAEGEKIVKQGDAGYTFFIVEEGELNALKSIDGGEPEKVMDYKTGDYFGELALLRDSPRQASVVATSAGSLLTMDRKGFDRMLGPLKDLMERAGDRYV